MSTTETPATTAPETNASEQTPTLTEKDKLFAATNDPNLAPDAFMLGEHEFKIVHLRYRDYLAFLTRLRPLFEMLASGSSDGETHGLDLTSAVKTSADKLLTYCAEDLPEMVALIARQTDATVTAQFVEEHAKSPFQLAGIVMKQVALNNMIEEIGSFFNTLMAGLKKSKQSSTPLVK